MCDYHPLEDGFYGKLKQLEKEKPWTQCQEMQAGHVRSALNRERLTAFDLLALLSPAAKPFLEDMAQKAQEVTIRNFGRTIQLFTPLYLANFCTNRCVYCGFNTTRHIERHMLSLEEVEHEALAIKATGLRDILALTGDAPSKTGVGYLASCVAVLARHFSSVAVEVPSMTTEEYAQIVTAGVSSVTLFQETYNEQLYYTLHPAGPKKHFSFRLDAPHRAISGGVRAINFGALLGLDEWQRDVFLTAIHADFLQRKYPNVDMSISLPRMRPCGETPNTPEERAFKALDINDTDFVQIMLAFRLFLPQAGITLSTREPAWLRDHLMPLGVTRMSAGVSTSVGGHAVVKDKKDEAPQFAISDPRSVEEVARAIEQAGYQPIYADWLLAGDGCGALSQGIHDALGKVCSTQGHAQGVMIMSKLQQGLARYLSQKQLDLLTSTHVGIAGAGGLGSNVAFMLVRSGLRNLTLVDFDQVDSSNLNRQAFFPQDVGKPKTEALAAHLRSLEPDLKLRCLCTRLTKDNAARIFTGCSIVIEALDQAEAKTMLFLALRHLKCFYVGASGLGGWGGPDMVQKQIGPSAVCVGDFKTEVNHKVAPFAPRVMQAAAMQADAVLTHILGKPESNCS